MLKQTLLKQTFLTAIFAALTIFCSYAQDDSLDSSSKCGVPSLYPNTDFENLPYFGNNKILLEILREHGYSLPDDYFQLDDGKQAEVSDAATE